MPQETLLDQRETLTAEVAQRIADSLEQAVASRGEAVLLVSGGSTPQAVYEALSQRDLPWSQVRIALVDERWVAPDHNASNEGFISRHLLRGPAAKASFIAMKTSADSADAGLAECEQRYSALPASADVCVLGMGNDGHTASLFPQAQGLSVALAGEQRCAAIRARQSAVTGEFTERMTVTARYLLAARQRILLIAGDEKYATYREALAGDDVQAMPVRALLHASVSTDVFWSP